MQILSWSWDSSHNSLITKLPKGSSEFARPIYMCFVNLKKAYDHVPWGLLWGYYENTGYQGHSYKPSSPYITRVRVLSLFFAGSQICFQFVLVSRYRTAGGEWLV